ncbi:hypothetical protein F3Y22_tig00112285pilonHSYRG00239 [Hibiscus syriacus]|uniref:Uncharacterized protein n=1 Tax=Hibiscus syriacus TaxID=106335 RepID=A0A6A2Y6U9_HIBSY|nr:hypothetical protein F3Y22_tig00112285pilonHSYRG00239 [Hibiscus syriacus]
MLDVTLTSGGNDDLPLYRNDFPRFKQVPVARLCLQAPLHASRFLMGTGNGRDVIAISLKYTHTEDFLGATNAKDGSCELRVDDFHVVPCALRDCFCMTDTHNHRNNAHYVRNYNKRDRNRNLNLCLHVSPSKDKTSPAVMEVVLKLP